MVSQRGRLRRSAVLEKAAAKREHHSPDRHGERLLELLDSHLVRDDHNFSALGRSVRESEGVNRALMPYRISSYMSELT